MATTTDIITAQKSLQDCLNDNNRFKSRKLSADQIGAENLRNWKSLVEALQKAAYDVFVQCENNDLTVETKSVNMSAVYAALKDILSAIGNVNDHKVFANAELATLAVAYSGKRGSIKSADFQFAQSHLSGLRRDKRNADTAKGISPEYVQDLDKQIKEWSDKIAELKETADQCIDTPTRASKETFRLMIEHKLGRVISDQKAKTWDELEAEEESRRKERNARNNARKRNKRNGVVAELKAQVIESNESAIANR